MFPPHVEYTFFRVIRVIDSDAIPLQYTPSIQRTASSIELEVWRIEGLSWLENTLKQNGLCSLVLDWTRKAPFVVIESRSSTSPDGVCIFF